jgi:hypothetical protein
MIHDSPKPTKRRTSVITRLSHMQTTIPGLIIIGAAILISRIEMDETIKTSIVLPLIAMGLGMLGWKGKKS